ncbi:MAG: heme ABC transporter ATP-binding protein [Pseudomonadota bacterium]
MLEANDVSIAIGRTPIVSHVSFCARAGEITTVIGPNGSGKTTLLRAITGDLTHEGTIKLQEQEVSRLQPWELAEMRAVLPQSSSLSFPFTVGEVVRFGLTTGRSGGKLEGLGERIRSALDRVDLSGFAGRFYQELSGGEQQRVQLARVLCQVWEPVLDGMPRWLFLDEPVSSLDIRHQLTIMDIARDFARAGGGVFAILHDLNLAAMYSDNVLVMHEGQRAGFGPASQVIEDGLLRKVFECDLKVGAVPTKGQTFVLPQSAA